MQGIAQNLLSQILLLDEDDQYEHFLVCLNSIE